jgi:amidohydrolase family protein
MAREKCWFFPPRTSKTSSFRVRALNVYEEVYREIPFDGLHWFFDHCETISDRNIERVKALGGGIAVQNRMAFQGEYFVERYGAQQAGRTPPIRRMLEMGVPVGAGTDATRVSSYNPFISLYWLVTGKTLGGLSLYLEENRFDREEALRLYTMGSSWFSTEDGKKGALAPGQLADLAVLSADYFSVPDEEIKRLESVLTIVGGKIVYATAEFSKLAPPPPPVSPNWSPVKEYGGYATRTDQVLGASHSTACLLAPRHAENGTTWHLPVLGEFGLGELGCDCFAFRLSCARRNRDEGVIRIIRSRPRCWCYLRAYPSKEPGATHRSVAWPLGHRARRTARDMGSPPKKSTWPTLPRCAWSVNVMTGRMWQRCSGPAKDNSRFDIRAPHHVIQM